ncbi:FtsX-like permease family protein [Segnochrobactraceae bacterium EtOH-i3]
MIPFRLLAADLRRHLPGALMIVLLIAAATGLGVAVTLQERALRLGSARAADRFDLVVGAAASETQLVLSSVFLQPSPLPLMPGAMLAKLAADPRAAWVAPVGFGDNYEGYPVVGSATAFITDGGRTAPVEGRVFADTSEAVIGAAVPLALGDLVKPQHGAAGEGGHTHTELAYTVVGRMAATGTPWDRAILVPIEGVWRIHGLGHHHDDGDEDDHDHDADPAADADHDHADAPEAANTAESHDPEPAHHEDEPANSLGHWDADSPGVPAVIVKARSIADAYRMRQDYRHAPTVAVFPAEVLTRLYATLGDARLVLTLVALGTEALVAAAVMLVTVVHLGQRRRELGALRALGASRAVIFGLVWSEILTLIGAGVALGFGLGYLGARIVSSVLESQSGIHLPVEFAPEDAGFALMLLAVAAVIAAVPALLAFRQPPAAALRS